MTRRAIRYLSLVVLTIFAIVMIIMGFRGWVLEPNLPLQYLGYFCLLLVILGLFGVNVWFGGILDPRRDPSDDDPTNAA